MSKYLAVKRVTDLSRRRTATATLWNIFDDDGTRQGKIRYERNGDIVVTIPDLFGNGRVRVVLPTETAALAFIIGINAGRTGEPTLQVDP